MTEDVKTLLAQLAEVKKIRAKRNGQRLRKSRLDPWRGELMTMHENGASVADLRLWLRRYRRFSIGAAAIQVRLKHWKAENEAQKNTPNTGEGVATGELLEAWRGKAEA